MPRGYGKFRRKRERDPRSIPLRVARRASGAPMPSFEDFVTTERFDARGSISHEDIVHAAHLMTHARTLYVASTPMGVVNPWLRMMEEHREVMDRYGLDVVRIPEVDINYTQPPRTATEAAMLHFHRVEGREVPRG